MNALISTSAELRTTDNQDRVETGGDRGTVLLSKVRSSKDSSNDILS